MPDLSRLLNPRSIAVIGGSPAARVVEQCQKLGYTGKIWPVHPTKNEMHGVPCFSSLAELPGVPDAAFVAVNRHLTLDAISQLSAMGAGGAVCYASGFAESGDVELQAELVRRAGELPILGPNCYGYINALDGIALWPDEHGCRSVKQGVGIISQSGNVGINLTMQQRGLNMAYMVTVGNQAGGGVEDALQSFIDDDRVTAIGMFIEAVREPIRFAQLAQLARGVDPGFDCDLRRLGHDRLLRRGLLNVSPCRGRRGDGCRRRLLSPSSGQLNGCAAPGHWVRAFVVNDLCKFVVSKTGDRFTLNALRARGVQAQLVQAELLFDFWVYPGSHLGNRRLDPGRQFCNWLDLRWQGRDPVSRDQELWQRP
jgi:succinyl-CoA synthetase alpha subunit